MRFRTLIVAALIITGFIYVLGKPNSAFRHALPGNPLWSEPESTVPAADAPRNSPAVTLPISVIVPVRNEGRNLRRCLESKTADGPAAF